MNIFLVKNFPIGKNLLFNIHFSTHLYQMFHQRWSSTIRQLWCTIKNLPRGGFLFDKQTVISSANPACSATSNIVRFIKKSRWNNVPNGTKDISSKINSKSGNTPLLDRSSPTKGIRSFKRNNRQFFFLQIIGICS